MSESETSEDPSLARDSVSATHLRFIIDAAPVLISYIGQDFRYRFVNQGYAEWFGRPVVELQGRHVRETVGSAAFDKVRHYLESALSGNRVTYEAEMPYENGPRRYVHTQLVPDKRDGNDSVNGIVAVVTDVSTRRATEHRLEESEQRYRSLFEQNVDAVFSFDLTGRFTSVNAACETFSGYTPQELLSRPFLPLIVPEFAPRTIAHFQRARQGESQTYETALNQKSGRKIDISVTHIPILVRGEVVGVYGIAKDITARKRRERRQKFMLRLSERTRLLRDRTRLVTETLQSVGEFLRLSRVWYADLDSTGSSPSLLQEWRSREDIAALPESSTEAVWGGPILRELAAGRTVLIRDFSEDPRTGSEWDALYRPTGIGAALIIPLFRGEKLTSVLSAEVYGESRAWSPDDSELLENVAQRLWVGVENLRVYRSEQEAVTRQRKFLREMLSSLTEGRLQLCEADTDLPPLLPPVSDSVELYPASLRILRRQVEGVANRLGLTLEHCHDLLTAVGEAGMNAVVHGVGGHGRVHADERSGKIQVWVQDSGTGISEDALPHALEIGKSSAGSLGHGFWLMLKTADRIWLLTGGSGTTVVLEQERTLPEPAWMNGERKT